MIVRAIDGRYLGHPLFFFHRKERPWQRVSPASKFMHSSCQGVQLQKLKHEMVTGKQNCNLFSSGLALTKECRAPVVSVSGPGALCVGAGALLSGPGAFCVQARPSVWGPGAHCVGPQRSLSRCAPAVSVSGPGAFGWFLRRGPGRPCAVNVGARHRLRRRRSSPTLFALGRSLCQAAVLLSYFAGPSSDPRATQPLLRAPATHPIAPSLLCAGPQL